MEYTVHLVTFSNMRSSSDFCVTIQFIFTGVSNVRPAVHRDPRRYSTARDPDLQRLWVQIVVYAHEHALISGRGAGGTS